MAHTRRTACKSTDRLPISQLAPRNVPQPQESQPDIPQEATPDEEPFEIELVVPESPTAQDSPAEEQQLEDPSIEDKTDGKQLPPSDTEPIPGSTNHVRVHAAHDREHGCYNSFTLCRGCTCSP
jgi:hypothetical protein